ncbi:MAG TPA: arsenite methyltransferase [Gemmatimonadales bacterium]|jgi:SAM-dependent methyltransferase
MTNPESTVDAVRRKYARAAVNALEGEKASCGCEPSCCGDDGATITKDLYGVEVGGLPAKAVAASLGCGNPTALTELHPGDVVLDLGSGGGLDVLLSARRVTPGGKAYGLDMTDEMLELARQNQAAAGLTNVEFLKGRIEDIPLPDASVDVVISNCVINLSENKPAVMAEAFRVLRPGGRLTVTDIVVEGSIPADVRGSLEMWAGCAAGALEVTEFSGMLRDVGFEDISIEPVRVYQLEDARALLTEAGLDVDALAPEMAGRFLSAFVRARKP